MIALLFREAHHLGWDGVEECFCCKVALSPASCMFYQAFTSFYLGKRKNSVIISGLCFFDSEPMNGLFPPVNDLAKFEYVHCPA